MKISVIVPNYNHAPYLKQRIDSILNQTYQDFELIILDDLSTDDSREILQEYGKHSKVRHIIYNEQNSGSTFKQWNKGIKLAQGEWIWIAESDDWCEPTLLANLVAGINKDSVISFCQSLMVQNDGKILWNGKASFLEEELDGNIFVKNHMMLRNDILNASMCIFKKECFYKIDSNFTTYKFCGDWLFWIEIALQGKVFISGKILNYFRKHDKDVSGKAFKSGLAYSEYIKLLKELEKKDIITSKEKEDLLIVKYTNLLMDVRFNSQVKNKLKKEFHKLLKGKIYKGIVRSKVFQIIKASRSIYNGIKL